MMTLDEFLQKNKKKKNITTENKTNEGILSLNEFMSLNGKEEYTLPKKNGLKKDTSGLVKTSEGNLLQTIGGTLADVGISGVKGAVGGVEDTFDFARYGYANLLDVLGREERADFWRLEAMQNTVDDLFAPIEKKVDKYSVAGDVLDDVAGAVGYIAALKGVGKFGQMAGLGEKGVGNLVKGAMFTSAMGGGMTEAYYGNATDKEAFTYGALTGTTAVVIEGLVGALGKSLKVKGFSDGKVDKYISKFADMITKNTTLKNTITTVSGALGEGVEEVAEGFTNAFAKKFTYMSEEDIWDIMKDEKLGEQFLIGTLASAVSQMPSYVSANKSGVDLETGYTKNEQQLHDAILKEKLDAVEGTLTKQERAEIEERVKTDIKKGNIDIDTIEKVLGGDTYKGYESVLAEMNEFNTLNKTKSGELTGEQADRLAKLKENNDKYAYQERVDALKRHLSKEVYEKTQNDAYIVESYNENAKKRQALNLDMSKYDEEHQKAIKILTENVKLNNTKKTHDMVETLSNIAVDRKLTFKCADAETMNQLAQNDGVIRNAYINGDEITFNPSSKKAINSLTVHEVLHDIKKKNPEMYKKLEKALIDFASSKGIYESKMQNIKETYKKIKGKDIDDALANEELAALLAEDYIATNEEFVRNLSTKKPNIFRRIYEEIKHLCKLATSGSEIHRNLEKARRMYEKAYREGKKTSINNDTRYSVSTEYTSYPKTKTTVSPTEAGLQDNVKTVREVRAETMLKNKYTQEDVEQINKFMDNMATFMEEAGVTYKFIGLDDVNNAKLKVAYDKKGNPKRVTMSAMVKNGDYPINFDFTSICKKRQSMSMVVKELANRQNNGKRALDTINLDTKALWTINEELRKAGLETACLGCFVESKRYNIQKFADKATNMWNSIVDEVRKEQGKTEPVESFNFAEGINIDDVDYNEVEGIFKNYSKEDGRKNPEGRMRALIKNGGEMFQKYLQPSDLMTPEGIEGMKSMSSKKNNFYGIIQGVYGTVAPKEVMGFTPYNSEIAMLPATKRVNGKSQPIAEYIASIGGVRMQSFSDFIVANVYDYMQMVADLSARHLPAHAYTKEIAFAKIFGLTGMKINMSVMFDIDAKLPDEWAGLKFVPDKNGTKEYNGVKGRLEYLVADKKRSDSVYEETGERPYVQSIGYDEAVELQNTEGYSKNVGIVAVGFSDEHIFMMLDDDNIRYIIPYHASNMPADIKEVTNIKKAKNYTDYQNTRNAKGEALKGLGGFDIYKDVEQTKNPKETANNYLKYCKEKGYTPMFEDFSSHDNYYKLLFDFDVYDTITGEYSPQTEVKNVYKGYNPEDGQYSTDELENLIDEEMKVQNEANEHRNEIISGVVDNVMKQLGIESETVKLVDDDTMYSLSEDSEGRTLTDGQREYFKDSKVVDDDGNLKVVYHGTYEDFTVFKPNEYLKEKNGHSSIVGYFSEDESYSKVYGDTKPYYLNIKNPLRFENTSMPLDEWNKWFKSKGVSDVTFDSSVTGENGTRDTLKGADYDGVTYYSMVDLFDAGSYWTGDGNLTERIKEAGYDGMVWMEEDSLAWMPFAPSQIKEIDNQTPTSDADIRYSLNNKGTENGWRVYFDDILLKDTNPQEDIAPVRESIPYQNNKIGVLSEEDELGISITDKLAEIERIRDYEQIAEILDTVPDKKNKSRIAAIIKANVLDKGLVFENLALKTKGKDGKYNRELEAKWNYTLYSDARAQEFMLSGAEGVKSLNDIIAEVENTDHKKDFYQYMYHKHNIDRMSLRDRYKDKNGNPMNNKPVFGDAVTSKMSKEIVDEYEKLYPEFKDFAQDVYDYMTHLRNLMVESGIITKQSAKLWSEMYPYYVPINRGVENGLKSDLDLVGIDTTKEDGTSVNAPIKKATGGSSNILPLFETMASRTMQTYKAIAKNNFGVELKNALGTVISDENAEVDDVIDSIDSQDSLLQEGKNGKNPTFTIFENGKRVTFEVTKDMYDALKPLSESSILNKPIPVVNQISNIRRGLITEFNLAFMLTNLIKDVQEILINSQHPLKTYKKLPEAFAQIKKKGYWYDEYIKNGGSQNTIFDNEKGTFKTSNKGIARMLEVPPLSTISKINQTIEMLPRLAEYIASREDGASVEVAMLDAARVTTNFKAGGNVTKFLNRNGCTFLNASVQGTMQQIRNFREAKANGIKGYMNLATKFAIAGLPVFLLNHLIWDDDEEYEELSDYIKQNYYVVWKDDNGQFVRVPKGRMLAVIQDGFAQMENLITGNDEVDLDSFLSLVANNVAPTNPADNNILAPINQVRKNETWYGEDLVPTRLQDLPNAEQYDESTDTLSKWLGEKLDISPVKINYLIDQYSGAIGDVFLPMMTPEAESGNDSFGGELIAPIKDKFTADAIMDNQNISDFYDKSDELTKNANSSKATDEDKLKSKYFSSMQSQISALYKQKREIQNSNLKDSKKYKEVRQIQEEIIGLCKEAMENYSNVTIDGNYATVGGVSYRNDNGNWTKVNDDQMSKQQEAMDKFGISGSEYWSNKDEYSYAVDNPEKYLVSQAIADFGEYSKYKKDISKIEADKDENGKSINGSRKEKVIDYINSLDIDRGAKKILIKMNYPSEDKYNEDIVEYLSDRDDISYDEMKTILKELGFTVKSDGTVTW